MKTALDQDEPTIKLDIRAMDARQIHQAICFLLKSDGQASAPTLTTEERQNLEGLKQFLEIALMEFSFHND
jgi:hypothetical protein